MEAQRSWVITLSGTRPLADVSNDIIGLGFVVEQVLEAIGIIAARGTEEMARKAREIPGVSDVSEDRKIEIGHPGGYPVW